MFLSLTQDLNNNQVKPLSQFNNHKTLSKVDNIVKLMSNICPHQNSILTKNKCDTLVCPYHGLKFSADGVGQDSEYVLDTQSVYDISGMLFSVPLNFSYPIDLSSMVLVEERIDFVKTTPEIFMDVFLDIDHIPVAHPGVYDKIGITDISQIEYDFFDQGSYQFVYTGDQLTALWTAVYPGTTIEWQQGALFVNIAVEATDGIVVTILKYQDSNYSNMWELNEQIWEQAWKQDKELCEMIISLPTKNLSKLKKHHRNAIRK
jgi:nitrite reductase/ring-hydroxylating ferredoxin subunit